jgi:hypothetical protein
LTPEKAKLRKASMLQAVRSFGKRMAHHAFAMAHHSLTKVGHNLA